MKKLARAVKEGTLHNLITELLVWLLDERVLLMDDGSQLLKAMNVLMLKILVSQNNLFHLVNRCLNDVSPRCCLEAQVSLREAGESVVIEVSTYVSMQIWMFSGKCGSHISIHSLDLPIASYWFIKVCWSSTRNSSC